MALGAIDAALVEQAVDEAVQLYVGFPNRTAPILPARQLVGISKVTVGAGATLEVGFDLPVSDIPSIKRQALPGALDLWIGNSVDRMAETQVFVEMP